MTHMSIVGIDSSLYSEINVETQTSYEKILKVTSFLYCPGNSCRSRQPNALRDMLTVATMVMT
jgi:hypothetical protein